jgi:hypothetical protein
LAARWTRSKFRGSRIDEQFIDERKTVLDLLLGEISRVTCRSITFGEHRMGSPNVSVPFGNLSEILFTTGGGRNNTPARVRAKYGST